jgi:hypothetical protein
MIVEICDKIWVDLLGGAVKHFIILSIILSFCLQVFPVTRSQIILTADQYARVHWKMTKIHQTGKSCNEKYLSKYPMGNRIGMGYMWGGWDTVREFLDKLKKGYACGPSKLKIRDYPDCVTGISCTGLISRAWKLQQKYRLNMPHLPHVERQLKEISENVKEVDLVEKRTVNLKKGDALLNRTHIVLFVYETRDKEVMIFDSNKSGVSFRKTDWNYLAFAGYTAIRYNFIKEVNNPQGTSNNPILIDSHSFPFVHKGNTRDVVSLEFDSYSNCPKSNEKGPEVIYKLILKKPGTISAIVTDIKKEGIDNNIYFLKSLKKDKPYHAKDCIAHGDNQILKKLPKGTYFIIVDSGNHKPGEYTFSINLKP